MIIKFKNRMFLKKILFWNDVRFLKIILPKTLPTFREKKQIFTFKIIIPNVPKCRYLY